MTKRKQSHLELEKHLIEQLQFLELSAHAFDRGFEAEAKRMAVTIRVLLHDTRNSHSLLGQLGLKSKLFWDLSMPAMPVMPGQMMMTGIPCRLVGIGPGRSGAGYLAHLDMVPEQKQIPFDQWWTDIVYTENLTSRSADGKFTMQLQPLGAKVNTLSRCDLVRIVTDQDGGAHVDPAIDERYAKLSRDNAAGWTTEVHGVRRPISGIELASIRQIAHEVLRTLK